MIINVRNLSAKTINLNIPNNYKIYNIKQMVQEMEGIDHTQQKILFDGKILDDNKQISETNIKPDDTLQLILALRL
jgi:ubiquitin C